MNKFETSNREHWNTFYKTDAAPRIPSQFCVFVANEIEKSASIVEFGCGNGRDSLFFSRNGWKVIGVDASDSAIKECMEAHSTSSANKAEFFVGSIDEISCFDTIESRLKSMAAENIVVYARFFLHAINESQETIFLDGVKRLLKSHSGCVALEFRTNRDENLNKTTTAHYRRFIKPHEFIYKASLVGLKCKYCVEGFGLAKYREDDAHVVRLMLELQL